MQQFTAATNRITALKTSLALVMVLASMVSLAEPGPDAYHMMVISDQAFGQEQAGAVAARLRVRLPPGLSLSA